MGASDPDMLRKMAEARARPAFRPRWTVDQPSRGLGDSIAKLTSAIGITPCGGCKERQTLANRLLPYNPR